MVCVCVCVCVVRCGVVCIGGILQNVSAIFSIPLMYFQFFVKCSDHISHTYCDYVLMFLWFAFRSLFSIT